MLNRFNIFIYNKLLMYGTFEKDDIHKPANLNWVFCCLCTCMISILTFLAIVTFKYDNEPNILPIKQSNITYPKQIIIIRHGEKSPKDMINLSKRGIIRSECLIDYFIHPKGPYNSPDIIYAQKQAIYFSSKRSYETVIPLARALNKTIITKYYKQEIKELINDIVHNPDYEQKTILISWEHMAIVEIAREIGCKFIRSWSNNPTKKFNIEDEYSKTWIFDFNNDQITFTSIKQFDITHNFKCKYHLINNSIPIEYKRTC
jgi:hypothetical protein